MLDLDALEALASAATKGPWGHYSPRGRGWPNYDPIFGGRPGDEVALVKRFEDHRFIAAAREAVPALIARVRELEAQRADVLAEIQALEHSDWLRDTIAGDRLRAALTDGTPADTERNES